MEVCVVIAGAPINNYEQISKYLRAEYFYIYCDSGLNHLQKLKYPPNLIIGDFDSYKGNLDFNSEIIRLKTEKDETDSLYAIQEAIKRGYKKFILLGMLGNRIDHGLANIANLLYIKNNNAKAIILDDFSEISLLSQGDEQTVSNSFSYFSVLNIFGNADGLSIKNAKYLLNKATIPQNYQYAISNELINEREAQLSLDNGNMLLVKIFK